MATVSGLGSQFSLKKEVTYGSIVAPDRGFIFTSESLKLDRATVEAKSLKGGNYLALASAMRAGRKRGGGDVQGLLYNHGIGLLLEAALGQVATTGVGPYTHTFTPKGTLPSYTGEVTFGGTSSVLRKRMSGMKVDSWEIKLTSNEIATFGLTWVYQDEALATSSSTAATLASAQLPYAWADGTVTWDGGSPGCVREITFSGNNNLSDDPPCFGTTTISEPVRQDIGTISGSMTIELDPTSTALYTDFIAGTFAELEFALTDGTNTLTITANAMLQGESPVVAGAGKLLTTIPFVIGADTTDASGFTIVAVNGDSAA